MKYLIFDFNGTIIDDVDVGLESENHTIEHFKLDRPPLTREEYLRLFTFPVKDYYEKVGFDWDKFSYEEVGDYWFSWYQKLEPTIRLHEGVKDILIRNRELGNKNIVLSASYRKELISQLKQHGIYELFDEILGIGDIYAGSKMDIAMNFIKDKDPKDCLMLGDTLHDKECADKMGVKCVLIAKGHQLKEILVKNCDDVYDDIREVPLW